MGHPPPGILGKIANGETPLEQVYQEGWNYARDDMPAAKELDRAIKVRMSLESTCSTDRLTDAINKFNASSSIVAWIAVVIALASLVVSLTT